MQALRVSDCREPIVCSRGEARSSSHRAGITLPYTPFRWLRHCCQWCEANTDLARKLDMQCF